MTTKLTDDELFVKLSEALGQTPEEVKQDYLKIVEKVKQDERFKSVDEAQVATIARNRLITEKRRELASPAQTWEGVIIGEGDLVDTVARQRQMTEEAFKLNPEKTQEGWFFGSEGRERTVLSDADGKALYPKNDINTKFRRAGKPLPEHSWLRNVFGVAAPVDKKTRKAGPPQRFSMTVNGEMARTGVIPMNVGVRFKGIDRSGDEERAVGVYKINASSFTKFETAPELKLPNMETIFTAACSDIYRPLAELEEYHQQNEDNFNRLVVTEGTVSILNLEPNPTTGNLRMVLDDESLLFNQKEGRSVGVTCWIPMDRNIVIDFAQDSRIYVVGRTNRGKARDPITLQTTDEPGDVMLNAYNIYCPDMFKVRTEAQPLTGKSLEPIEAPRGEGITLLPEGDEDTEENW